MNFVFILFTIALVSGVQSASISTELEKIHKSISQSVEQAVAEFKKVVDQAKEKANELRKKVTDKARQIYDDTSKKVSKLVSDIDNQLRDLWKRAGKIDISKCKAAGQSMIDLGKKAIDNMGPCIDQAVQSGSDLVKQIVDVSKNTTVSASVYSEEARKCFQKNEEGAPTETVVQCLTKIGEKIKETASNSIDIVSDSMSKMGSLVSESASSSPNSMASCLADKTLTSFFEGSNLVLDEAKSCLKNAADQMKQPQKQW